MATSFALQYCVVVAMLQRDTNKRYLCDTFVWVMSCERQHRKISLPRARRRAPHWSVTESIGDRSGGEPDVQRRHCQHLTLNKSLFKANIVWRLLSVNKCRMLHEVFIICLKLEDSLKRNYTIGRINDNNEFEFILQWVNLRLIHSVQSASWHKKIILLTNPLQHAFHGCQVKCSLLSRQQTPNLPLSIIILKYFVKKPQ